MIKIYPTLVIRPGESIEVGVESGVVYCGWGVPCRRVVVAASPGEPVELEIVPHDTSTRMGLAENEDDDTSKCVVSWSRRATAHDYGGRHREADGTPLRAALPDRFS